MKEQTEKQKYSKSPLFGYRKPVKDECGTWCNCTIPTLTRSGVENRQAYCLRCGHYWYN
ncbi:MAG: hypothetical protein ACRDEC_09840 [Flavobacterium sp.]